MAARTGSGGFEPLREGSCTVRSVDVLLVAFEQCCALDLVGPSDVFATAGQLAGDDLYSCVVVTGSSTGQVRTESGVVLVAEATVDSCASSAHTILVSGGNGFDRAMSNDALVASISEAGAVVPRVASVCSGTFLLAAAGLLDGRRATTHWAVADRLAREFPLIDVVPDEIFVMSDHVMTSAGVTAGIDLALAIVAQDHGDDLARAVARRMVIYVNRSGGQSQFSERLAVPDTCDPGVQAVLASVRSNPGASYSIASMASQAGMSARHFTRRFRDETGTTPTRWVERVRVDAARELLERTATPPPMIARASGFGSYDTMRQTFRRVLGVSPARYRAVHRRNPPHTS